MEIEVKLPKEVSDELGEGIIFTQFYGDKTIHQNEAGEFMITFVQTTNGKK